jgi:hypothetical protein
LDYWIDGLLDYWVVWLIVFFCALVPSNKKSNFIEKNHTAFMVFLRAREIGFAQKSQLKFADFEAQLRLHGL